MGAFELKAAVGRLMTGESIGTADYHALVDFIDRVEDLRKKFRWVPIKEQLPKDSRKVLLLTSRGAVFRGYYDHVHKCWRTTKSVKITHWRLPDGPEDWDGLYAALETND